MQDSQWDYHALLNLRKKSWKTIFCDVDDSDVYIDDVGYFSKDWNSSLELLDIVLHKLHKKRFYSKFIGM